MDIINPAEQVDFAQNKRLLNRYRYVEYEMLRILAGWLPATKRMELKLAIGRLLAEAIHAPSELDLLAGLCRVIKPALARAYRWHIQQTFANPDAPTLYAFKHILMDETEHIGWADV